MKKLYWIFFVGVISIFLLNCGDRKPRQLKSEPQEPQYCQIVNFYVENSGSMKGYFSGNSQIKDIIKEYYDRIDDCKSEGDTITLNFINTQIDNSTYGIKDFLMNCQNKCTATYTKIDDILSKVMEYINDSTVSIVISDYCFTSNNSSFPMAQSGITGIFSKNLKKSKSFSIAIIKYMSDFHGNFFPGNIPNNKPLPFYLWIFGNENQVKRIINAPIKAKNSGILILQPSLTIMPKIIAKARMIEGDSIILQEWDKDRHSPRGLFASCSPDRATSTYTVKIELDLSKVIKTEEELCDTTNYSISKGYSIKNIIHKKEDVYCFEISTNKPAPGSLMFSFIQQELPEWVEKSNYNNVGIPRDSTTFGIKYLIGGVYDAYHNLSNKVFETKITLK